MHLIIHFNADLGDEDEALALARRLFAHFDQEIGSLALVPVDADELDLYLDGRLVHARSRSGRAPRLADVLALLADGGGLGLESQEEGRGDAGMQGRGDAGTGR
jgi:predicted Rdx family selenoprotein